MSDVLSAEAVKWIQAFTGVQVAPGAQRAPGAPPGGPGKPTDKKTADKKPDDKKQPEPDLTDEMIEQVIGDPQKKLEEMAKRKIPVYSDGYKTDTPRSQFLADMESGTTKAAEYIDYMAKAADYAQKYGKGLEGVAQAAGKLKSIATKLKGGLGTAGGVIARAKQVSQWIDAVGDFADVSAQMNPKDRKSVEHWVASMQNLWNRTAPFADWLKDKATVAAIAEGSEAGAALSVTLSVITAQLYLGGKTLEVGLKNVNAYLDRYEKIMHEIDVQSGQAPPDVIPPPPEQPGAWMSREEMAQNAKSQEESELRRSMRGERDAKVAARKAAHDAAVKRATEEFEGKLFVKIYLARRPQIRQSVLNDMRSKGTLDASWDWWDCFTEDSAEILRRANAPAQSDDIADEPGFDRKAGAVISPTKKAVSEQEAVKEIARFRNVAPCPYVQELHDRELTKHLAAAVPQ